MQLAVAAPPGPTSATPRAPERAPSRVARIPVAPLALAAALLAFGLLPRVHESASLLGAFAGAAALLAGWALLLWAIPARRAAGFAFERAPLLRSHYLQATLQLCLYAYWGWYWRDVYAEIPLILAQLVFLYAFDALLSWSRGRAWKLGCGPLPIILSTNVFLWFKDDVFAFQFALIATAALGKEFIRWERDGRRTHVFNPSAFALALFSVALIATDTTDRTWAGKIADTFTWPPHIYLLIFGLGLVVQYFFSVTLMTLSAAATLALLGLAYTWSTGTYWFVFSNIPAPVFLGFHLLVTDPATSPRTRSGRVLFGALYGVAVFILYGVLTRIGSLTVYDKLLPIPLLNLSVRWIDALTREGWAPALDRLAAAVSPRRWNLVHMGVWCSIFLTMLGTGFVGAQHEGSTPQFWRQALAEGRPNASHGLLEVQKAQSRAGNTDAWNELGGYYLSGTHVPKDPKMAARCFARASKLGSLAGSANLVTQFFSSPSAQAPRAVTEALDHLERECAGGGDGTICFLLGFAYETGRGRIADGGRARAFYAQAAALAEPRAKGALKRLGASARPGGRTPGPVPAPGSRG